MYESFDSVRDDVTDIAAWMRGLREQFPDPVERAVQAGRRADRLGYAFAAGYDAALCHLLPEIAADGIVALCATEDRRAHPREMKTTLSDGRIHGRKQWATLGDRADQLLIVCSIGWEGERNQLRLAQVRTSDPGVRVTSLPPLPFAPEIGHCIVELDSAEATRVWETDAWTSLLKPFRTVEDGFVFLATAACLAGEPWPDPIRARLLFLVDVMRDVVRRDPSDPKTWVTLGGALLTLQEIVAGLSWPESESAARFQRDLPLLGVAARARTVRLERGLHALLRRG